MAAKGKETVLLYNMETGSKGRMVKLICMQMGIRVRSVEKSQYLKPVGQLAGLKGIAGAEEPYEGEGFADEMLIMCGLTGNRIDQLLDSLRRQKVERIALKAVLTEHNQTWDSIALHAELRREHEYMSGRRASVSPEAGNGSGD